MDAFGACISPTSDVLPSQPTMEALGPSFPPFPTTKLPLLVEMNIQLFVDAIVIIDP